MVEYIEDEYEKLKAEYEALKATLSEYERGIQQAYMDPETREPLKKILNKHAGIVIDDPPYEKAIKEEVFKVQKKLEEYEQKQMEKEREKALMSIKEVFDSFGITQEELPEIKEFISKTGIVPTTAEGWRTVLQNYQRSKITKPTYVAPTFKERVMTEDYLKNPKEAFYKAHLEALNKK